MCRAVLVVEAAVAAALLFKMTLWKLTVLGLKRGRCALVTVKAIAGVILALLGSTRFAF